MGNVFYWGNHKIESPNVQDLLKEYINNHCMYTKGQHTKYKVVPIDELIKFLRQVIKVNCKYFPKLATINWDQLSDKKIIEIGSSYLNQKKLDPFSVVPYYVQNGQYNQVKLGSTFIHVRTENIYCQPHENIDLRIYINLKSENVIPFIKQFLIKTTDKHKPEDERLYPYFKFHTGQTHDQFIIYSSYQNVEDYFDILTEIKQEFPKLCELNNKIDINLGKVDGWMGIGEEPSQKPNMPRESFSSLREDVVESFFDELYHRNVDLDKLDASNAKLNEMFKKHLNKNGINPSYFMLNNDSYILEFLGESREKKSGK